MLKKIASLSFIFALFFACSSNDDSSSSGNNGDGFDRSALLVNWADNIIIPAYTDLDSKLTVLKSNKDVFIATPNQTNLDALRASWLEAYKVYQSVEMFNVGKAEEIQYNFQMNIYPTTVSDVETNVSTGNYDLTNPNNHDAIGFPAVDYLLYGVAQDDASILAKYTDVNYQNYLSDVVNQMQILTASVLNDWTSNYRNSFVASTDNTSTSSVNKVVNDYVNYYERDLRKKKVGTPAGSFSAGTTFSESVEGFYSKIYSKELLNEALDATQDFFNGEAYSTSATGTSFVSYLSFLGRTDISETINTRFNNARAVIQNLNANLASQVETDNTKMTQTYDALQLAVVSLKVDMMGAFQISLDSGYTDNDGD
jgi:predicted lipoprotein